MRDQFHTNKLQESVLNKHRKQSYSALYPHSRAFTSLKNIEDKTIYIYGAGEAAHWFYEIAHVRRNINIEGYIDKNAHLIQSYNGIPCMTPKELMRIRGEKFSSQILIIVCLGTTDSYDQVLREFGSLNLDQILYQGFFIEIQYLYSYLEKTFQVEALIEATKAAMPNIAAARELLTDLESIEVFDQILFIYLSGSALKINQSPRSEQYFPKNVDGFEFDYQFILNCGAYDGDVIREIEKLCLNPQKVLAYEPDPHAYERLRRYVSEADNRFNVDTFQVALTSETGVARFETGGGLGSRLTPDGSVLVETVSIDFALGEHPIDMITMDIEGQELNAIIGAEKTLREKKPKLGICVYHKPSHLWQLITSINSINPSYRFALRNYTGFVTETVLYAY